MNKLLTLFKNIFNFELFFVLFLFAGKYKTDPRFAWVPVDLTALLFGLSILGGVYVFFVRGFSFRPKALKLNAIYLVFVMYAFTTYIWTPGEIYAQEKMLYLVTLTFWPLLATSLIISSSYERLRRFLIIFVTFACWVAIESFLAYLQSGGWKIYALGGNYLGVGRIIGPATIILLIYVLFYADSLFKRVVGVTTLGFFLYVQLVTGGRGPLLASIIPMLIPLLAGINFQSEGIIKVKRSFPIMASLVGLAALGMIYLMNSEDVPVTLRRLGQLLDGLGRGDSAQARLFFYTTSLDLWSQKIFIGYGVGSWPVLVGFVDTQAYPHNIILETLVEFGFIGLMILISLFVYGIRNLGSWNTIRNNPLKLLVIMILANALLNASVSGDIPDNRFVFGALGLMMLSKKIYMTDQLSCSTDL